MATREEIENNTDVPDSFQDSLLRNYLGSPAVVEGVLQSFIGNMLDCLEGRSQGKMSADDMVAWMRDDAERFSLIFSGEDRRYVPVEGWNGRGAGLSSYLKADLGHYWSSQRASHGDDPFKVAHAWLLWAVADALKKNDDELTAALMGSRIQQLVRLLTGTAERK